MKYLHDQPPLRVIFRWRCLPADRFTCYDCGSHIPEEIPNFRVPFVTQSEISLIIRVEPLCKGCAEKEKLNPRYD